jgi:hypothetical protein
MSSYQLADVIRRLERIEERLSTYRGSDIGNPNRERVPPDDDRPIVPVKPSQSEPVGPSPEPPPLLEPLLEQGGASEGQT